WLQLVRRGRHCQAVVRPDGDEQPEVRFFPKRLDEGGRATCRPFALGPRCMGRRIATRRGLHRLRRAQERAPHHEPPAPKPALHTYLAEHQVRSVAMEATGVYWLPLYGVLEAAGMEVVMVDGRQTRNLPGRKTDMKDCQWGATLHAHGLLRAGFVPPASIRRLQ